MMTENRQSKNSLTEILYDVLENFPDKHAIVEDNGKSWKGYTFKQLADQVEAVSSHLQGHGLRAGSKVLCLAMPSFDFTTFIFSLIQIGAIPVLIDPGVGRRRLLDCIEQVKPDFMFCDPLPYLLKLLCRKSFRSVRLTFSSRYIPGRNVIPFSSLKKSAQEPLGEMKLDENAVCVIAFTSGSTGPPKGVVLTQKNISSQKQAWDREFNLRAEDVDLVTFPLLLLMSNASGRTCIIPKMDFRRPGEVDPRIICETATRHQATFSFGSPALWYNVVAYLSQNQETLPSYRVAVAAGAPITSGFLEKLKIVLPNARAYSLYGATEALPITVIEAEELSPTDGMTTSGKGICVGRPVGDLKMKVIPLTNEAIPLWSDIEVLAEDSVGELVIRGEVVSPEYYNLPEMTAAHKIYSNDGRVVWHRLGDVGRVDDTGRVWIYGRKSHTCTWQDEYYYPLAVESLFNHLENVRRTALVNVRINGETKLALVIEPVIRGKKSMQRSVFVERAKMWNLPLEHFYVYPSIFPVDPRHNAKIDRSKLSRWAQNHEWMD